VSDTFQFCTVSLQHTTLMSQCFTLQIFPLHLLPTGHACIDSVMFVLQPGAQYCQKPSLYSPSKAQATDPKQVDDLGMDMSRQGKRWFPFSDGPRNCVGQALAKMNMAATFAQLYSHFSFQLADEVCLCMCLLYSKLFLLPRLARLVKNLCIGVTGWQSMSLLG
jgi:hypothetical protein